MKRERKKKSNHSKLIRCFVYNITAQQFLLVRITSSLVCYSLYVRYCHCNSCFIAAVGHADGCLVDALCRPTLPSFITWIVDIHLSYQWLYWPCRVCWYTISVFLCTCTGHVSGHTICDFRSYKCVFVSEMVQGIGVGYIRVTGKEESGFEGKTSSSLRSSELANQYWLNLCICSRKRLVTKCSSSFLRSFLCSSSSLIVSREPAPPLIPDPDWLAADSSSPSSSWSACNSSSSEPESSSVAADTHSSFMFLPIEPPDPPVRCWQKEEDGIRLNRLLFKRQEYGNRRPAGMEDDEQDSPLPEVQEHEMDDGVVESFPPRDRTEQKDVGLEAGSGHALVDDGSLGEWLRGDGCGDVRGGDDKVVGSDCRLAWMERGAMSHVMLTVVHAFRLIEGRMMAGATSFVASIDFTLPPDVVLISFFSLFFVLLSSSSSRMDVLMVGETGIALCQTISGAELNPVLLLLR